MKYLFVIIVFVLVLVSLQFTEIIPIRCRVVDIDIGECYYFWQLEYWKT